MKQLTIGDSIGTNQHRKRDCATFNCEATPKRNILRYVQLVQIVIAVTHQINFCCTDIIVSEESFCCCYRLPILYHHLGNAARTKQIQTFGFPAKSQLLRNPNFLLESLINRALHAIKVWISFCGYLLTRYDKVRR